MPCNPESRKPSFGLQDKHSDKFFVYLKKIFCLTNNPQEFGLDFTDNGKQKHWRPNHGSVEPQNFWCNHFLHFWVENSANSFSGRISRQLVPDYY